jgi:hypothetical protein
VIATVVAQAAIPALGRLMQVDLKSQVNLGFIVTSKQHNTNRSKAGLGTQLSSRTHAQYA